MKLINSLEYKECNKNKFKMIILKNEEEKKTNMSILIPYGKLFSQSHNFNK